VEYINIIKSKKLFVYKKEYLIKLLLKLDCILSNNDNYIKNMRKKLIIRINKALDFIESELSFNSID
jgi:hypothetical protein